MPQVSVSPAKDQILLLDIVQNPTIAELAGTDGVAFLSAGTDGVDGSSDAAGAVVTGGTCSSPSDAKAAKAALAANDSHAFFLERPERLVTGPTGTNVADLVVALAG